MCRAVGMIFPAKYRKPRILPRKSLLISIACVAKYRSSKIDVKVTVSAAEGGVVWLERLSGLQRAEDAFVDTIMKDRNTVLGLQQEAATPIHLVPQP